MRRKVITTIVLTCILCINMCMPLFAAKADSAGNIIESGEMVSLSDEQTQMLLSDIKEREFDDESISVSEAFWAMRQAKQFKKDVNME